MTFSFSGLKLVSWFEVLAKIILAPGCSSRLEIFPCQVMWVHIKTAHFSMMLIKLLGFSFISRSAADV